MMTDKVSVEEIMQVIYQGGFMPADTPLENIPQDLWGYLSSNWDKAMNLLNTQIRQFQEDILNEQRRKRIYWMGRQF